MTNEQAIQVLVKLGKNTLNRIGWFSESIMSERQMEAKKRLEQAIQILDKKEEDKQ